MNNFINILCEKDMGKKYTPMHIKMCKKWAEMMHFIRKIITFNGQKLDKSRTCPLNRSLKNLYIKDMIFCYDRVKLYKIVLDFKKLLRCSKRLADARCERTRVRLLSVKFFKFELRIKNRRASADISEHYDIFVDCYNALKPSLSFYDARCFKKSRTNSEHQRQCPLKGIEIIRKKSRTRKAGHSTPVSVPKYLILLTDIGRRPNGQPLYKHIVRLSGHVRFII